MEDSLDFYNMEQVYDDPALAVDILQAEAAALNEQPADPDTCKLTASACMRRVFAQSFFSIFGYSRNVRYGASLACV